MQARCVGGLRVHLWEQAWMQLWEHCRSKWHDVWMQLWENVSPSFPHIFPPTGPPPSHQACCKDFKKPAAPLVVTRNCIYYEWLLHPAAAGTNYSSVAAAWKTNFQVKQSAACFISMGWGIGKSEDGDLQKKQKQLDETWWRSNLQ